MVDLTTGKPTSGQNIDQRIDQDILQAISNLYRAQFCLSLATAHCYIWHHEATLQAAAYLSTRLKIKWEANDMPPYSLYLLVHQKGRGAASLRRMRAVEPGIFGARPPSSPAGLLPA